MSTEPNDLGGRPAGPGGRRRWKRWAAAGSGVALITGAFITEAGPFGASASSHREAPLIAGDPRADNTDLYAFVSPDDPNSVTLIANWLPFEEPNGGPNFFTWADDTRYNIKIDNNGDALPDLTYTWIFDTVVKDPNQFLYNTGPINSLNDPDLNIYQTYDLTVTNGVGQTFTLLGDGNGVHSPGDPIAAPSVVGPASTPDYTPLRDQAIYAVPGGGKTYAGQADDPFFLDLRVFDLLYGANATEVGTDTLAGYNVNTVALQLPKNVLATNGNATRNPVIGIWSTTDRRSAQVSGDVAPDNEFVQVSRLGNPLVNEVVVPLALKDAFNAIDPVADAGIPAVVDKVLHPILPGLIQQIYGVPAPAGDRNDLFEIFLQGVSKANAGATGDPNVVLNVDLNSQALNMDAATFRPSEMLRLNMSVAPAAKPNRYGVLAGDIAGFPNGRRLTDDVVDIAVQAVEGAAQAGALVPALLPIDSVDRNDQPFSSTFPYLALPNLSSVNTENGRSPRAPEFISMPTPLRILETRTDQASGQIGYTGAKPSAGQTVELKVTGVGTPPVPDDATTVMINVTSINAASDGFVTVFPCGSPKPLAASFNPIAGVITHNLVAAQVGAGGKVCIYTSGSTDLVADLSGYHPYGSSYVPKVPERFLETRTDQAGGQKGYSGAKPTAGQTITLDVTGIGTTNVPNDAKAVLLNVAAVNSSSAGFITAFACGSTRPLAASLSTTPGLVRANLVAAPVGTGGNVCIYTSQSSDLIVDIEGYVPGTSQYVPVAPQRVLETRESEGQIGYSASMPRAGQTTEVKVTGVGTAAIPADAGAVFLNVSVVNSASNGFITVFPCGTTRPLAANLNLTGETKTNLVAAKIGDGGRVCIYSSQPTDLTADVAGYFPGSVLPS